MNREEVLRLAKLARIEIGEEEADNLSREFDAILSYVDEIKGSTNNQQQTTDKSSEDFPVNNVMRDDNGAHESGEYSKEILEQAPNKEGNYIKVKKIL